MECLFNEKKVEDFIEGKKKEIHDYLKNNKNKNINILQYKSNLLLKLPVIEWEKKHVVLEKEKMKQGLENNPFGISIEPYTMIAYLKIPYIGEEIHFKLIPERYTSNPPYAEIAPKYLTFKINTNCNDSSSDEEIRRKVDEEIWSIQKKIDFFFTSLQDSFDSFNRDISSLI